jgi:hypothetical protein
MKYSVEIGSGAMIDTKLHRKAFKSCWVRCEVTNVHTRLQMHNKIELMGLLFFSQKEGNESKTAKLLIRYNMLLQKYEAQNDGIRHNILYAVQRQQQRNPNGMIRR